MKSLQGSYLRMASGSMRTTPTEELEITLGFAPLNMRVLYIAKVSTYRLYCLGEWRDNGLRYTRLRVLQKHPFTLKQDRTQRKYQLRRNYKVRIPTREDWGKTGIPLHLPFGGVVYLRIRTTLDRYGVRVYGHASNYKLSIPLGELATIFQAGVIAILKCAEILTHKRQAYRDLF